MVMVIQCLFKYIVMKNDFRVHLSRYMLIVKRQTWILICIPKNWKNPLDSTIFAFEIYTICFCMFQLIVGYSDKMQILEFGPGTSDLGSLI